MSNVVHCYPVNDLRDHQIDGITCECQPKVELVDVGTVVVHNSWDGREITERAMDRILIAGAMN